jgi:hypothetical protein
MKKCLPIILFLICCSFVQAQTPPVNQAASPTTNVGHHLDRVLKQATLASEAASLVLAANEYRQAATEALKAGNKDEARKLFRQSAEVVASALPERDEKREDPFLREYLTELTSELLKLDTTTKQNTALATSLSFSHPSIAAFTSYYQGRGQKHFSVSLTRFSQYEQMMREIFQKEGVPEWLLAVGLVESGYNPLAQSPKQALGIWQFIPATANRYGLKTTELIDERQDSRKSTRAAAQYLRDLYALFGDWMLALAAYNAGEERIAKIIRRTGIRDFWLMVDKGLLPQETASYVPAVLASSQLMHSKDFKTGDDKNVGLD